jgi:hypothetical protein
LTFAIKTLQVTSLAVKLHNLFAGRVGRANCALWVLVISVILVGILNV